LVFRDEKRRFSVNFSAALANVSSLTSAGTAISIH